MTEEAGIGNGDKLEKRQGEENKIGEEEKQKEKQGQGERKRTGRVMGKEDRQQVKTNVIIPSSVGQRAF